MSLSVSSIIKENEDFIESSIQQLELELDPTNSADEELVRRAVFAVRNKYIIFDKYIPTKLTLQISIKDVRPARVLVHFKEKELICDCNKEGWCRHKVSAIFALYQQINSLQDWVSDWRAKKSLSFDILATNRTTASWNTIIKSVFSHYVKDNQKIDSSLLSPLMDSILSILTNYEPFEREWKPIYKLYMETALLNTIWEYLEKNDSIGEKQLFDQFLIKQIDLIETTSKDIKGQSRLFATDPFFDELQLIVRKILLDRKGFEDRKFQLYLIFWDRIFIEKKRIQNEINYIEEQPSKNIDNECVMSIFYILLKDEEKLQNLLHSIEKNQILYYIQLAKFAISKRNASCGEMMLKAILPFLHYYIHEKVLPQNRKQVVQMIHTLYEKFELKVEDEKLLFSSFGIYGISPYSNYLLKNKRFHEWAALQQLYPSSLSFLESTGLKIVLEEEPKALLPLLHFYAVTEINQKTRMNYKEAVNILKRMKEACQRAGKRNFWDDYILQIQKQYKRLKAFQQELNKEQLV